MASSAKVERILHEVAALSDIERAEVVRALASTDDDAVTDEWREEIQARVREIDEGRVQLIPHGEVMRHFREDIGNQRNNHA